MMRFSFVRDPLLIMSNNDFESIIKCVGAARQFACSICDCSPNASLNRSANAMN